MRRRATSPAASAASPASPGREDEFRRGVDRALEYADALALPARSRHGRPAPRPERAATRSARRYRRSLAWAARTRRIGRASRLLIEPINTRDIPGYLLNRQDDAHALVAAIGAPNLKVQMDLYHCQIVEGDVAMKLREYVPTRPCRPSPDRRRARAPRARRRRAELRLPLRRHRCARLSRAGSAASTGRPRRHRAGSAGCGGGRRRLKSRRGRRATSLRRPRRAGARVPASATGSSRPP